MSQPQAKRPRNILDVLRRKRNGEELSRAEVEHLVEGDRMASARLIIAQNIQTDATAPTRIAPLVRRTIQDNWSGPEPPSPEVFRLPTAPDR